jgi:thiamine pyrophosphate-dependent acetolactate synthase large subunit-like protein
VAKKHGGKILADRLALHGVDRVFSVPGESFLAALDGLMTTTSRTSSAARKAARR